MNILPYFNTLENSHFGRLPGEVILYCFSFLEVADLSRVTRVCKVFQFLANHNELWKPIHVRKWQITSQLTETMDSWKERFKKVQEVTQFMRHRESELKKLTVFWRMGFVQEEMAYNRQLDGTLNQAIIYVVSGERVKGEEALKDYRLLNENPSNDEQALIDLINILQLLSPAKVDQALAHYLERRQHFITHSPLVGWWASHLIYFAYKAIYPKYQMDVEHKIAAPKKINKDVKINFQALLQGCCAVWLRTGEIEKGWATFLCLEKSKQWMTNDEQSEIYQESSLFLDYLSEAVDRSRDPSHLWEKLGDHFLNFSQNEDLLHYDYLNRAAYAYGKAIRHLFSGRLVKTQMRVVSKLALALVKKDSSYLEGENAGLALLPIVFLKESARSNLLFSFTLFEINSIVEVVRKYKVASYYSVTLRILERIDLENVVGDEEEAEDDAIILQYLLFNQIELYRLTKRHDKAIETWIKLYLLVEDRLYGEDQEVIRDPYNELDIYELMYQLLEGNERACRRVLSVAGNVTGVQLAKAYALYQMNKVDDALRIICQMDTIIDQSKLQWLFQLSLTNFKAVIAYSLQLSDLEELEDYFIELKYPRFFIYHNLAVRIFFEDHLNEALEYAQEALKEDPEKPETQNLIKMIYHRQKEEEETIEDDEQTQHHGFQLIISPPFYSQNDLLIMPVD